MKTSKIALLSSLTVCAVACGDAQTTPDYKGESLLELNGQIETTSGVVLDDEITPVVLWWAGNYKDDFSKMTVQEVDVTGAFPGKFQLDIYQAPPESARSVFAPAPGLEDEPSVSVGLLGALPRKHDASVILGYDFEPVETKCGKDEDGSYTICVEKYCDYYEQCWTETADYTQEEAVVTASTGTPAIRAGLGVLAGLVGEYQLVFLDGPAKKGSLTAFRLGSEELEAGFHLIHVTERESTPAEDKCTFEAEQVAGARFEKETGEKADLEGEYTDDDLLLLDTYVQAAVRDAGCFQPGDSFYEHLEVMDLSELVTMQLGTELTSTVF